MKRFLALVLFFLFAGGQAFAQATPYYFKHYDINSRLSHNTVTSIFQDSRGFIWIGTKNGLNRFDGHDFKIFQRGDSPCDLKNSMIYDLAEDLNHNLWIATDKGVNLYDPFTERFSFFDARTEEGFGIGIAVNKIAIDGQNRAWILAGPNLLLYEPKTERLELLNEKFREHALSNPSAFYVDTTNGLTYVGFPGSGLFSYNPETGRVAFVGPVGPTPTDICGGRDNSLLVGTINKGLYRLNRQTGESKKLSLDESSDVYVRVVEPISKSEYWVGTESGVYILKDDQVQQHLTHEEFNDQSLSDNAIYAIFRDREGGVWIGSYFGGVDYIPRQHAFFKSFYPIAYKNSVNGCRIRTFVADERGNLWIATEDNGLNYYDVAKDSFTHVSPHSAPLNISYSNIQCLNLSRDKLWVGTFSKGIDVLDLKTRQRRHYEKSDRPNSLVNNDIFAIYTDRRNTTWIGSSSGVSVYVPEIDGFRIFDRISASFISDILEDSNGYIWFTTFNKGVIRYDPGSDAIRDFRHDPNNPTSLCYDRITCAFEDSKRRLWFASEDGGFCLYNEVNETFTRVTTGQGLPSNVIYKILEDNSGHLWMSTNNGLVDFDPETMAVKALYNLSDGLQCRQFNYNSGIRTRDGRLWFGSIDGFVAFNPGSFRHDRNTYRVVPTEFYILNREVRAGGDILDKAIPYAKSINLSYRQATFTLGFSALNYSSAGNQRGGETYAYLLEGVDQQWNYTDNATRISYNSIPPGNYAFRIRYSRDGREWSDEETRIQINVIPPLWRTAWAYALYTALLLSGIFIAVRLYLKKKQRQLEKERAQQEQQKKEEIYTAKIDFFTDIAHEIRTPLTLIKVPLNYILNAQLDEQELKANLTTMERNADRLLELVNQLLDFRKIESEAFTLSLKEKDINTLVTDIYNRFVPTARQRRLEISLECPPTIVRAFVDEEALTKVCSNLFSNAIKYASTYIRATLSEDPEKQLFRITVSNDGVPIPADMRQHIFEAFFQIRKPGQPAQPGSGIGLTLAMSLTQLHNGRLYLDEQAEDTTFVVQIPTNIPTDIQPAGINTQPAEELYEETGAAEEAAGPAAEAPSASRETVLVVEDNEELRTFLTTQLNKQYRVVTAGNGTEALTVLDEELVSLIVSDVMMPVMDGLELCRSIKSNLETCHIPIILLTAKATLNNKIEGLKSGADAYIEKPFSMAHLLVQINNLLEGRMKLRQNFSNSPYIATNTMAQNKADEEFLNRLTEIIRRNLEDNAFSVDDLASEMNMSRTSLHRKIKGVTSMTPGDFIRIIRLKRAAELLREGEYRINEICILVGINSLSYFSKCFQKQFGILPKDFAKSQGKGPAPR